MRNMKTRMIVEAGIMMALAYVLSMVKIFQMPNGGTITAGSMIPILIFAIWFSYLVKVRYIKATGFLQSNHLFEPNLIFS